MRSQNIKNRGSRGLAFMLPLLLLSMASCIKYPATNGEPGTLPDVPKGMVRVGLYTSSGDYQTPVTRTMAKEDLDEDSMPWVFVFVGNGDNALFAEVKQATAGATQDAPPSVVLTQQSSAVRVLIVANAPETFFNGTANAAFTGEVLTTALDGKTFGQAVNDILNTAKLTASPTSTSIPYVTPQPQNLPMTGKYDLDAGINTGASIGTAGAKVALTRVVAKVTVTNSVSPSIFSLDKASVIGAKQFGRLYQTAPVTAMTGNGSINFAADIVSAVSQTTNASPLYIYESASGETSMIIRGTYNGTANQYYRLAFKGKADGTLLSVERNKHYKFEIVSVEGSGYGSFIEAATNPPSNMLAKVEVTDLSSHDIIDNGKYYLGVSNSEFIVYADGAQTDLPALTVSTDADAGIQINVSSTNTSKLTVSKGAETITDKFRYANITVSLKAAFTANESVNFTITLGNLQKTIKVTRRAQLTWTPSAMEFAGEYAAGEIVSQGTGGEGWLSLSLDGETPKGAEVTHPNGTGNIYLMAKHNIAVIDAADRLHGVAYLYRHNEGGRVKIYVTQKKYLCYPAFPGVIGYDPNDEYLNLDGRGFMVYFKFGSVVAMYAGRSETGYDLWYGNSCVAFNPRGNVCMAYTDVTSHTALNFPAHAPTNGKGDPCRLIGLSLKDIKAGNINNGQWRLPTGKPYEDFNTSAVIYEGWTGLAGNVTSYKWVAAEKTIENGGYGHQVQIGLTGAAADTYETDVLELPATGSRMQTHSGRTVSQGQNASYWTSTYVLEDVSANWKKLILQSNLMYTHIGANNAVDGNPVRCVRQ